METWHFGIDNDKLVDLVLKGKKTATTSIYNGNSDNISEESILTFANEKKACITKAKKIIVTEFKNITPDLACLEGEGPFEEWKINHINYFKSIDPNFNEDTKVEFEIFEVTENLVLKRLNLAKKIVEANKDIFKESSSIKEINAGFNNSIFDVDNKYIIKVCDEIENEKLFGVEFDFYVSNQDNDFIPKLYRFDNSKEIVPFVYEIIEKINGKSVYYYWYKISEKEKEELIKKLMEIIKKIHSKEYKSYDWSFKVKKEVLDNYYKCKEFFNKEEENIIMDAISFYDEILFSNKFVLIHNDLHFDNILLDKNNNIKIIDFNDSIIAPFDYDLRIFYMCIEMPWKWANIEMDPYQKKEDYKNIFEYVKKYYPEVNNLKYLEERMIIYSILNDIRHLPRFKNMELKNRIVDNSKLINEKMKVKLKRK